MDNNFYEIRSTHYKVIALKTQRWKNAEDIIYRWLVDYNLMTLNTI